MGMSFDIYGEWLQPGHCEVHPYIHEEYPCSACLASRKRKQRDKRAEQEHWAREEEIYYGRMVAEHRVNMGAKP